MHRRSVPVKKKDKIIFIVGPTAVGKSALAVRLAKKLNGEIISCDSMQVYRLMRILSQAPSAAERGNIRHRLLAVVGPEEEFSVAQYIKMAGRAIRSALKRGKQPIVVGGTGLYARALIDGLFPSPEADMAFRRRMEEFARKCGKRRLYGRLERLDPDAASGIHPNDTRRTIRALEVLHSTGKTMTEMKRETKGLKDVYDIVIFGLKMPRQKLYRAIDSRVDRMFDEGLAREVRRLSKKRLSRTAALAIGLPEILGSINGERSMDEAKELMKTNTRRFAKRQLCWFGADKRIRWFDVSKVSGKEIIVKMTRDITLNPKF